MGHSSNQHVQVTTLSIIGGAILATLFYGQFLLSPPNRGDLLPYLLLVLAEFISMVQLIGAWWTILAGVSHRPDPHRYEAERLRLQHNQHTLEFPAVDVFVTVCGEDLAIVQETIQAARDIRFPHKTFVLDDGNSPAVRTLAAELNVYYIARPTHEHAKAGNINFALNHTAGKYIAIFDADHVPKPNYLEETLPFFWNRNLAFVQTPQYYNNRDNFIAVGAAEAQDIFYSLICPGKNRFNSVFWVGTNAIFSRAALESVGGVYLSNSEDIWTSYLLHQQGWESMFLPTVLAVGKAPDTTAAYLKQQLRWATGGFEIFFRKNPLFSKSKLTADQKIQYLLTSSYYFTGLSIAILMLLPALFLYFDLLPIYAGAPAWLLHFLPYVIMQFLLVYHINGRIRWQVVALSMATFPVHLKAILNAVRNKRQTWEVTNKARADRAQSTSFHYVLNQLGFVVMLISASLLALLINRPTPSLFMALAWTSLNILILSRLIAEALPKNSKPSANPAPIASPYYETIS